MSLFLIFAHDEQGGIGLHHQLPWHHRADLKWFKSQTDGHAMIMGRKTADGFSKPLPGRTHYVLSRTPYQREGFHFLPITEVAKLQAKKDVFVIGGAQIFEHFWPHAHRVYRTMIHQKYPSDTFFKPSFSSLMLHQRSTINAQHDQPAATFEIWVNPRPQPLHPND